MFSPCPIRLWAHVRKFHVTHSKIVNLLVSTLPLIDLCLTFLVNQYISSKFESYVRIWSLIVELCSLRLGSSAVLISVCYWCKIPFACLLVYIQTVHAWGLLSSSSAMRVHIFLRLHTISKPFACRSFRDHHTLLHKCILQYVIPHCFPWQPANVLRQKKTALCAWNS